MPENTATIASSDRRERFRAYMKRFNPTAPAWTAIREGLVHQDPARSVFKKLAAGADLNPGSQQLVAGGIGSGKTTELLLAEQEFAAREHRVHLYIDESTETDLSTLKSGALLATLGLHLWEAIKSNFTVGEIDRNPAVEKAARKIRKDAFGYEQVGEGEYDSNEPDYPRTVRVPGILRPPMPRLKGDVEVLAMRVSTLTSFLSKAAGELLVIFDGLDRLLNPDQFWAVVEQDLRAMRPLGISVLMAGPLSVMYGHGRQVKDYFDEVYYLPPAIADQDKSTFLLEVLALRSAEQLMAVEEMLRLCLASGGVLRDLISLARNAGQNAYLDDADVIDSRHVDRAIEQLGNSYLMGLGMNQKEKLMAILEGGSFSPSDPESMELLVTRRVLERSESRYEVHPALASVLAQAAK